MAAVPQQISSSLKLPPQALEAEQSLLGGLLVDTQRWDDVSQLVRAEDFYTPNHQDIFRAIRTLHDDNQPVDIVTTSEWLEQQGILEDVGGLAYLGTLANNISSTANLGNYARIVQERSLTRRLIRSANDIIERSYNPEGRSTKEIMDIAETAIFDITQQHGKRNSNFVEFGELLGGAIGRIEELYQSGDAITGLATGFKDLDDMTAGLQPADLIVIAGRPSMGKTALAMNIVEAVAIDRDIPIAVFSMEMSGQQLAMRMLTSLGRINAQKMRTGKLGDDDWPRLTSAIELLNKAKIFIDDSPGLTPLEVRSRARNLARSRMGDGLGLIVVDYLQLMQATDSTENRATEISNITRALKMLAKELNVPVIAISQLNRSLEQRPNKRPVMSDLRESGAIEQDADVIIFIYRDEVYNEDSPHRGTAEIIIGKQRNGPIGMVRTTFLGEYTRFENYAAPAFEGAF